MAKGKNPKKETRKQPKTGSNPHPTDYQQERANAKTSRRKDKSVQG